MSREARRGGAIFVNHRRDDQAFFARSLHERIARAFADREVFFDLDSIGDAPRAR